MTDYHYKDLADEMLANFDSYIRELCELNERETGRYEFTSQQMLKKVAQQNQALYVQLLERCRIHFPDYIFNKANEDLSSRIANRAKKAGFEKFSEGMTEINIFGDSAEKVIYRRKS